MGDDGSLQAQIDDAMGHTPPELVTAIDAMVDDLRRGGTVPGLEVGERAPSFTLPAAVGGEVALDDRLADGPVVLTFYRGAWCPICNLELRALQRHLPELEARGARLIAVNPQRPDDSLSFAERLGLGFDVLADLDQEVAAAYRLRFRLSDELVERYTTLGLALPDQNADGTWNLPVPATFVLDGDGIVRARHVDPDYRQRMEPAAILAALDTL